MMDTKQLVCVLNWHDLDYIFAHLNALSLRWTSKSQLDCLIQNSIFDFYIPVYSANFASKISFGTGYFWHLSNVS